ncbi:MAG: excinuclease ABC subunit UvrA, partial [Planctomycetota bacterium]
EFDEDEAPIGLPLVDAIAKRLSFLSKVGVDYLTLNRSADTHSGGEFQRVRLATSIGSGLVGVCYVLDEPSIGLHHRDNARLIGALRDLQQQGNTVLVVEHDDAVMREADHLIDMGPGAGNLGGEIVSIGEPQEVMDDDDSLTGRYLCEKTSIPIPAKRRKTAKTRSLVIQGAATHNLQSVEARIPLGALVCVTGVSGSGKSSLINETLAPALIRKLGNPARTPGPFKGLRGTSQIDKVIQIDQSPIGRSPRSNPATYTGVFDEIRKVFAGTRESKQRGFKVGRFSFNNKEGRCDSCQGQGVQKIEMSFLPDLYVTCDECNGARFNRQTLQVRYRGQSIADILNMRISDAAEFFENFAAISRVVDSLNRVGLGYLPLGQPSTTLSGGEAQRIKLATELARVETGQTLYLLDEPTTGLHFDDIRRLLDVLQGLVEKGNTVLVIEHNLEVIKCADWILDLGPEGGAGGGHVVAEGTPEDVAKVEESHTGQALRECFGM